MNLYKIIPLLVVRNIFESLSVDMALKSNKQGAGIKGGLNIDKSNHHLYIASRYTTVYFCV